MMRLTVNQWKLDCSQPTPLKIKYMGLYVKNELVGKTVEEIENITGSIIRITKLDGNDMVITDDFLTNRLNVEVENGIVTNITGLG
jgi:hypothetical protein